MIVVFFGIIDERSCKKGEIMKIVSFEDLSCWKEARKLVNIIYQLTRKHPFSKDYRLRDQVTGAAISIMNNIAEGFDSQANREFIRFLCYARRSASEVKNCLYIAKDQEYISEIDFTRTNEVLLNSKKQIDGFLRYLRTYKTS